MAPIVVVSPKTQSESFERAVEEGDRRLDRSSLELVSTSFIAGFTVLFGVVALGIVEALVIERREKYPPSPI